MTLEDATAIAADVAEALAYAHAFGIVHRDVKPENIFAVGGRALLADFGIARIVGEGAAANVTITTSGTVLGTASYMSPEQGAGETNIDGRSDLYSLGCVLYELLTGAPPFTAPTFLGVLSQHFTAIAPPLSTHGVRVSEAVEQIIMKLLAKNSEDRPANAGEVVRMLRGSNTNNCSARRNRNAHHYSWKHYRRRCRMFGCRNCSSKKLLYQR